MTKPLLLLLLSMAAPILHAETPAERDARMAWWREARFGMFIHWGVSSIPAGKWKGKTIKGYSEWIQDKARIPASEYEMLKTQFNPVKYKPEEWALLAKAAGMKYLVITSKHHDGFCLWDSAQTDWDIASTPYRKDLLKPLAEACRKHGIKFCLYHSIMDWHHPDWGRKAPWRGNHRNPAPDMDRYTAYMKAQLKELLANYGDIGVLWFDGEWESAWTHKRGLDLDKYLRGLQPDIIVNNRVDKGRKGMAGLTQKGGFAGDYGTPEQRIPATGLPGIDWESCMTMNTSWGYKQDDHNWKSASALVRNLIDIVSKGGNYLLNVGPTGEGEIPQASIDRLQAIGKWMDKNSESIHGTTASPFSRVPFDGRVTRKGKTLYLHLFSRPENGKITLETHATQAAFLDGGRKLETTRNGNSLAITLPGQLPDPIATVIKLQ